MVLPYRNAKLENYVTRSHMNSWNSTHLLLECVGWGVFSDIKCMRWFIWNSVNFIDNVMRDVRTKRNPFVQSTKLWKNMRVNWNQWEYISICNSEQIADLHLSRMPAIESIVVWVRCVGAAAAAAIVVVVVAVAVAIVVVINHRHLFMEYTFSVARAIVCTYIHSNDSHSR